MPTFYQTDISIGYLFAEESKHAVRVLRLTTGDPIEISDGKGNQFTARVVDPDPHHCTFKIIASKSIPRRGFSIHLAIAPTKNADRIEWMVEKSVELGVEKISFVRCATSERKAINMERLEKIVVNAVKQSQQAWLPELVPIMPLEEFIRVCKERHRFIAHVDSGNPVLLKQLAVPYSDYVAMVGPEGDFTGTEIASAVSHGFKKVSLGSSRLRSETAGLAIVMTLNLLNQQ